MAVVPPDLGTDIAAATVDDLGRGPTPERVAELMHEFAYAASHDLQEPLQVVRGYLGLLQRRAGKALDDESTELLGEALAGTTRMETMLRSLLAYSRAGPRGSPMTAVRLDEALDAAVANVGLAFHPGAVLERAPLPEVVADEAQIVQVFQNLLSNALKFHQEEAPARIAVQARRGDGEWILEVTDQGIGIAPEDQGRIFGLFTRLHAADRFPGTGVGLAICKRIVERHGGRIWVASRVGHGATFAFSIPDRQRAQDGPRGARGQGGTAGLGGVPRA